MAKRKPDVRALLQEGQFAANRDRGLPPADPIAPTSMILPVDAIRPYDRNPRRRPNPKYEDIYRSIKAKPGLADDPLTVTRRPGDEHFIVKAGGNTRLEIHQALWRETGDPVYRDVFCLFVPWESESEVLRAHIVENEARGELIFIDLARALMDLKRQIEDETGESLSRNEYLRRLGRMGYVVSKRQLIRYAFAVEVLEPLIPKALASGLGGWNIDQIRDIHRAYHAYHEQLDGVPSFESLFGEAFAKHDGEVLDLDEVRTELDVCFSRYTGLPPNRVHLSVERLVYDGRHQPDVESDQYTGSIEAREEDEVSSPEKSRKSPADLESDRTVAPSSLEDRRETLSVNGATEARPTSHRDLVTRLATARSRCRAAARRFAATLGLEPLIVDGDEGFGFCIDLPAEPLPDEPVIRAAWWSLLGLSEITLSPYRLQLAPPGLALQITLIEDRSEELHALVGTPPVLSDLPFCFLSSERLPDEAYAALIELVGCCRMARRQFRETELWNAQTVNQYKQLLHRT